MNLHTDRELFTDIYVSTAEALRIDNPGIVEKDYYVTLFLKKITQLQPNIIFKGGTSLSKCYKAIQRFSEDIDLSMDTDPTQGQRKELKSSIVSIIDEYSFSLLNPEEIRSRRDYNRYVIDFGSTRAYQPINQHLIVETTVFIKSFPNNTMNASSMIYDFLKERGNTAEIAQFGLEPFPLQVLSIEGSFIDKVFALGDYYLSGAVETHSRHIYDLYKLLPKITFNTEFRALVSDIRKVRKSHAAYLSVQDDVDVAQLLNKIIESKFYKKDYERITQALLFENLPYDEAICAIRDIAKSGYF